MNYRNFRKLLVALVLVLIGYSAFNKFYPRFDSEDQKLRFAAVDATSQSEELLNLALSNSEYRDVAERAVKRISEQKYLNRVAIDAFHNSARREAVERISDQALLERLALTSDSFPIQITALKRISNPQIILQVLRQEDSTFIRKIAVSMVRDEVVLAKIVLNDNDKEIRSAALTKLRQRSGSLFHEISQYALIISARNNLKRKDETSSLIQAATAVQKISTSDYLGEIAGSYRLNSNLEKNVFKAAVSRLIKTDGFGSLTGQKNIRFLFKKITDGEINLAGFNRKETTEKLLKLLKGDRQLGRAVIKLSKRYSRYQKETYTDALLGSMRRISDQKILVQIAQVSKDFKITAGAVAAVNRPDYLAKLIHTTPARWLVIKLLARLDDRQNLRSLLNKRLESDVVSLIKLKLWLAALRDYGSGPAYELEMKPKRVWYEYANSASVQSYKMLGGAKPVPFKVRGRSIELTLKFNKSYTIRQSFEPVWPSHIQLPWANPFTHSPYPAKVIIEKVIDDIIGSPIAAQIKWGEISKRTQTELAELRELISTRVLDK